MAASKPRTIDEYLALLDEDKRAALEKLRKAIRAAVPEAKECISYQIPAFRLHGKLFVAFGAAKSHCAFYPGHFADRGMRGRPLAAYDTSKGTIRFPPGKPLPATLVKKLVKARL